MTQTDVKLRPGDALYVYVLKDGTAGIGIHPADGRPATPEYRIFTAPADPVAVLVTAQDLAQEAGCKLEVLPSLEGYAYVAEQRRRIDGKPLGEDLHRAIVA